MTQPGLSRIIGFIPRFGLMRSAGLPCAIAVGLLTMASAAPGAGQLAVTQLPCGTRDEMIGILTKTYGEHEVAHGLANTGALAQVFVGPKGTWTIVATSPNGTSCLIGAGEDWERTITNANTNSYDEGI